jgi:hypothetical protein
VTNSKPSNFLLALFRGKSADEDDESDGAPVAQPVNQTTIASAAPAASAAPVPLPRPKPPAAFRLASADVLTVPAAQPTKQAAAGKPQTPADIINARGFWDEIPSAPKQATPQQVIAAISARQALAKADPQSTAGISDTFQALAYAPPSAKDVRRARIVAATASIPPVRRTTPARNPMAVDGVTTVVVKGAQDQGAIVSTSRRLAPAATRDSDAWMRAMILAPSASRTMSATALGDQDMTLMQVYFEKPDRAIAMTFSDNPQMGIVCDRFTGSAVARLTTTALVAR